MNWTNLVEVEELDRLIILSNTTPVLLFKHSTRCSVSLMAKRSLESEWNFSAEQIVPYYLDLITYRSISNRISEVFNVTHESPQAILLKNGKVIYHASHSEISAEDIGKHLN
jgi:bacillithiol system protein YtxJ